MIVVDTNVLSELMRPTPVPSVLQWAVGQPAADLVTTAVAVATRNVRDFEHTGVDLVNPWSLS